MRYVPYLVLCAAIAAAVAAVPGRTMRIDVVPFPARFRAQPPRAEVPSAAAVPPRPVPKPVAKAKPAVAASSSVAVRPAVAVPAVVPKPAVADIPIDLRSVVVVKCLFKGPGGRQATAYGSGVVINPAGYVLTARHVVDMPYTYRITGGTQGFSDYILDSCRIAVPPDGTETPTPAEIRTINPFTPVTEFAYGAELAFVPPDPLETGMSEGEYDFADSALLRIVSAANGTLPRSFIASPVKIVELPAQGDEVVSFGFPSGVPSYGNNFYLQGSVGEIRDLVGGDRLFKNQPVGMTATMETIGGRSGSPVFWHGYVAGVIRSKEDYSRNTAISAVFPIARFAEDAGLAVFK